MKERTLAHYEVLDKIGEGGMGEVYRARDTQLGREVAIKILPEIFSADPERLVRFEREARLLASLNHPRIAVVHGLHVENGTRFLAMELVPGRDLASRLQQGPLPPDEAIPLALQVAQALEAAHEQGVVHRDLKPSNIMITPDGRAKVLDFGLAKSLDAGPQEVNLTKSPTLMSMGTMQGMILGTAAYMSPEQARGRTVDRRCDIWSFGVVMFEMLTGKQLFTGETVSDVMAEVLKSEIDWSALPAGVPPALTALLRRCLDRDAATRLRDAGEARIALARIQSGHPGEAVVERAKPGFLRSWGGWILAAAALLAAAFAMIQKPPDSAPQAQVPLRKSVISMSREDPSLSVQFAPALSPDGRYLAYLSHDKLWVRDLAATEPRFLAGTEGAANPFWSPDGMWIGFGREQAVFKVPREGGTPSLVARLAGNMNLTTTASSGSWTEDGRVLMSTGVSGILVVSAQGGEVTTLVETKEGESDFHELTTLPGGEGLVMVVHDTTGVGNLDAWRRDGTRTPILKIEDAVGKPAHSPTGHMVFQRGGDAAGIWAFPFSVGSLQRTGDPFLVAAGASSPTTASDGTLVYVTGIAVRRAQMVVLDRKGEVVDVVGPAETVSRPFPEISPDGRWVLHASSSGDGREVFRYDLATRNRQRVTFNDIREDMAVFLPDGRNILFHDTEFETYEHPLESGGESRKLFRGIMAMPTRDGSRVVYSRQQENAFVFEICLRDLEGGDESVVKLVSTGAVDFFPQLSPDERFMAYFSDETGHDEVYVTTFPTPTVRWQVSTEGGSLPRWRADGREIVYTTRDAIWSVTVNSESGFSFTPADVLFKRPHVDWNSRWPDGFDMSEDGERFVLFRPVVDEEVGDPSIVVVQNWFEEFRREPGASEGK